MDFDLEVNENGLDSFELVFPLAYRIAFMVVFGKSKYCGIVQIRTTNTNWNQLFGRGL